MMLVIWAVFALLAGCEPRWWNPVETGERAGEGGGQDEITVAMPFAAGYTSQCVQGSGGSYSHGYASTRWDVDLDTPNYRHDEVFAPASGVVRVHSDGVNTGFGLHINLLLPDGSFLVVGHLYAVFVADGEEVAEGQLLGLEGTTGNSTGDHVHFGRHTGDAGRSAGVSSSVVGLRMRARDVNTGAVGAFALSELACGIPGGHFYRSTLQVPAWHPSGSLVKAHDAEEVYVIGSGMKRHVANEAVFYGRNWSFLDLAVVTQEELACYPTASPLTELWSVALRYSGGTLWLLDGPAGNLSARRYRVRGSVWEGVARSWGFDPSGGLQAFTAQSGDLPLSMWPQGGDAKYREGTLIKEQGLSDVYVIEDGTAKPIESWETFLLLDYWGRQIVEVPQGQVAQVQESVGDCASGAGCITKRRVLTCGGSIGVGGGDLDTGADTGLDSDSESESDTSSDTGEDDEPDSDTSVPDTGDSDSETEPDSGEISESDSGVDQETDTGESDTDEVEDTDSESEPDPDPDPDPVLFTWYLDADSDSYGRPEPSTLAPAAPTILHTLSAGDCNDLHPLIHPAAQELCDGVDNDCNELVDEAEECSQDPGECDT
jgi:hypothetical protein